jgi:hypothetical protein
MLRIIFFYKCAEMLSIIRLNNFISGVSYKNILDMVIISTISLDGAIT